MYIYKYLKVHKIKLSTIRGRIIITHKMLMKSIIYVVGIEENMR
jgi:hypothetical protein